MPDTLNKQSLINLLIDSPLREPIKINLIDIVNNTSEPDLPKVYSTITKELEIFQKATERRMKLADETITKLSGGTVPPSSTPAPSVAPSGDAPVPTAAPVPMPQAPAALPPLDLPPLPKPTVSAPSPVTAPAPAPVAAPATPALSVPPLDLPPMPTARAAEPAAQPVTAPVTAPVVPPMQPLGGPALASTSDEDALAEIQKELDSLKTSTASEIQTAAAPTAAPAPQA